MMLFTVPLMLFTVPLMLFTATNNLKPLRGGPPRPPARYKDTKISITCGKMCATSSSAFRVTLLLTCKGTTTTSFDLARTRGASLSIDSLIFEIEPKLCNQQSFKI